MDTLESLADALDTTGDIQSIVRTMKALSSVSIRQYDRAAAAMADYARTVELGLMAVLRLHRQEGWPLPRGEGKAGRPALIVIGSDRGLCGGYNDKIARFALSRMGDQPTVLGVIGTRAAARLEAAGRPPDTLRSLPGSVEGVARLVQSMIVTVDRWTGEDGVGELWLVHNCREGAIAAKPQAHRLLPLPASYLEKLAQADWPGRSLPMVRMDPAQLMSWLVQQRLFVVLYRALAEALASEHASRLAAMQAAERNIEDRRTDLQQLYRQRRQETITRELLDVVSGFEAVSMADRTT